MMPKCSPVRCTILAPEQPLPARDNKTETPSKGLRCGAGQTPSEG